MSKEQKSTEAVATKVSQPSANGGSVAKTPEQIKAIQELNEKSAKELEEKIQKQKDELKELQKQKKALKSPNMPRALKGVMVTFKNKAGVQVTGMGSRYYVVRMDGKLHYKEESQVTLMTEDEIVEYNRAQAAKVK